MRVFVSSTVSDLKAYRARLNEVIKEKGYELLSAGIDNKKATLKERLKLVGKSDVVIGIYAHRYGTIPQGESTSYIEQEFQFARKSGKDILCFVIDPKIDWPERYREDDFIKKERLSAFLGEVEKTNLTKHFRSTDDVLTTLVPALQKYSDKYDRIEKLQAWSKDVSPAKKFKLLNKLTDAYVNGKISDSTYGITSRLIAGHFNIDRDRPPSRFIDQAEALLQGKSTITEFVKSAHDDWGPVAITQLGSRRIMYLLPTTALLFLLLGVFIGKWMFSTANSESAGALQQEVRQTAAPISEEQTVIISEEEKQREEAIRRFTELEAAPAESDSLRILQYQQLKNEFGALLDNSGIDEALRGLQAKFEAQKQAAAEAAARAALELAEAQAVETAQAAAETVADTIESEPSLFDPIPPPDIDDTDFQARLAMLKTDTVTIHQTLDIWEQYAQVADGEAARYAVSEIERINELLKKTTVVRNIDEFITCLNVNIDTRMPEDTTYVFSPGKIWMWARLTTTEPDTVRARWMVNGRTLFTNVASIPVASSAYRIFFSKTYNPAHAGNNEIRLYNGDGLLIGRRTFQVSETAPEAVSTTR